MGCCGAAGVAVAVGADALNTGGAQAESVRIAKRVRAFHAECIRQVYLMKNDLDRLGLPLV
jgi:hypothetical protein